MKNFLLGLLNFLLGLLINYLYMYVVLPIFFVGITALVWMPLFFESSFAFLIGIVISILTLVVTGIVEGKLGSY